MKKFMAATVLAGLIIQPAFAVDSYTVDPQHTFPSYEVSHFGFSTQRGRFNKTSGRITFDRAARTISADISIDADSISTGLAKVEDHLRSEDFFDTAKYPTLTFRTSNFKFSGDDLVALDGDLTIRGVTRPVTLTVTSIHCALHPLLKKEVCGADANVTIRRSDFGMKAFLPAVGDDIRIAINVEAIHD